MNRIVLDSADQVQLEEILSELQGFTASDRYKASSKLYDFAGKKRTTVDDVLRHYYTGQNQSSDGVANPVSQREESGSLENLTDHQLVDRVSSLLKRLADPDSKLDRFFTDEQLQFMADLSYKLRAYRVLTLSQRAYAIDMLHRPDHLGKPSEIRE